MLVRAFFQGTKPLASYLSRLGTKKTTLSGKILNLCLLFLVLFSVLFFMFMFGMNFYSYQVLGMMIDIPDMGMFVACLTGFAFLLVFSSSSVSAILYRGKDEPMVISFPVTEKEMVASRLFIAYFANVATYAMVVFPALVATSFINGVQPVLVLGGLFLLVTGPLLPLSLGILVSSLTLRLTKGKRHILLEQLVSLFLVVGLMLAMTGTFARNLSSGDTFAVDYQSMLTNSANTLKNLYRSLAIFVWQGRMVFQFKYLLFILLGNLAMSVLLVYFVAKGFNLCFSFAQGNQIRHRRGGMKKTRSLGLTRSLMKREMECIMSSSAFTFELFGELGIPVILLVVYGLSGVLEEMESLVNQVSSSPYFVYGVFALISLFSNISMLSSTSVSRQGNLFEMERTYPVKGSQLVKAKLLFHLALVFPANILYLLVSLVFFQLSMFHLLWMGPLSMGIIVSCAVFGLGLDYAHPLLDWTLARQAVKSNLNGLFSMLCSFLVILVEISFLVAPVFFWHNKELGITLALVSVLCLSLVSGRFCVKKANEALLPR
jgi:ABC-2 type transport system permease protein